MTSTLRVLPVTLTLSLLFAACRPPVPPVPPDPPAAALHCTVERSRDIDAEQVGVVSDGTDAWWFAASCDSAAGGVAASACGVRVGRLPDGPTIALRAPPTSVRVLAVAPAGDRASVVAAQPDGLRAWLLNVDAGPRPLVELATLGGAISAVADFGRHPVPLIAWSSATSQALAFAGDEAASVALEPALRRALLADGQGRWARVLRDGSALVLDDTSYALPPDARVDNLVASALGQRFFVAWTWHAEGVDHLGWFEDGGGEISQRELAAPSVGVWLVGSADDPLAIVESSDATRVVALNAPDLLPAELPFRVTGAAVVGGTTWTSDDSGAIGRLSCRIP